MPHVGASSTFEKAVQDGPPGGGAWARGGRGWFDPLPENEKWAFCRERFRGWLVSCFRYTTPREWASYRVWGYCVAETPDGVLITTRIVEPNDGPPDMTNVRAQCGLLTGGFGWGLRGANAEKALMWMVLRHWAGCEERRYCPKKGGDRALRFASYYSGIPHSPFPGESRREG